MTRADDDRASDGRMAATRPPIRPGPVAARWAELARPDDAPGTFAPDALEGLPEPVQRWLGRAIDPGARLARRAELTMHGHITIGRRLPFTARQVLAAPDGFIWAASAGIGPLRITGFDRFTDGTGEMSWRLLGLVPVMNATGEDVSRSAAGRLAGEALLLPAGALAPWCRSEAIDHSTALARIAVGGAEHRCTIDVAEDGTMRSVWFPRWGDPDRSGHREVPFGVTFGEPVDRDGVRVAGSLVAGWGWGEPDWADRAFFRATIDTVRWC